MGPAYLYTRVILQRLPRELEAVGEVLGAKEHL